MKFSLLLVSCMLVVVSANIAEMEQDSEMCEQGWMGENCKGRHNAVLNKLYFVTDYVDCISSDLVFYRNV